MDQVTRVDAVDSLRAHDRAWVRVAAVRQTVTDRWKVRLLEITTGGPPPCWEQQRWGYPTVLFDAYSAPCEAMAGMLTAGEVRAGDEKVALAPIGDTVSVERRESRSRFGPFEPLEWPAQETRLNMVEFTQNEPVGPLLSDGDAPSFASFYLAAACFLWGGGQVTGGQINPESLHRHQDFRGRIKSITAVLPEEMMEIELQGQALGGLTVELAGGLPGPRTVLDLPSSADAPITHTVTLELVGGIRPGAWVVLRDGSEWLDRRDLKSAPWWQNNDEVEVVEDQATRLEVLVGGWEREGVEFKRQVPRRIDRESKLKVMKTVCAFANGSGGSLLIGVDDDDRSYVGVDPKALDNLQRQLGQMVRSWIEPSPVTQFEVLPIPDSDRVVLELAVQPGTTLYVCGQPGEIRRPYVRHHSSTEVASRAEILALAQRSQQVPIPGWGHL